MTDTKPTLKAIYQCPICGAKHNLLPRTTLKSQPVPVEPDYNSYEDSEQGDDAYNRDLRKYIDSLQSALQVAQQERDESKNALMEIATCATGENRKLRAGIPDLLKRAEKAEASNKRLVDLLREAGASINFLCELVRENNVRLQYRKQTAKIDELLREAGK